MSHVIGTFISVEDHAAELHKAAVEKQELHQRLHKEIEELKLSQWSTGYVTRAEYERALAEVRDARDELLRHANNEKDALKAEIETLGRKEKAYRGRIEELERLAYSEKADLKAAAEKLSRALVDNDLAWRKQYADALKALNETKGELHARERTWRDHNADAEKREIALRGEIERLNRVINQASYLRDADTKEKNLREKRLCALSDIQDALDVARRACA